MPGFDAIPEFFHNFRVFVGQILRFVRIFADVVQADWRGIPRMHVLVLGGVEAVVAEQQFPFIGDTP